MSTRKLYWLTLLVGIFLAGCSATLRESPGPQAGVDPGASVSNAPAQIAKAAPSGGPQEGIKVHGHWTIEVRNPDGTLGTRREFENALTPSGASALAEFLARTKSVGSWRVNLEGSPVAASPCVVATGPIACSVVEPASGNSGPTFFPTLTIDAPTTGPNAGKFVLRGTATAQRDGNVGVVGTDFAECSATVAPSVPCPAFAIVQGGVFSFTSTTPIPVSAGQQIQVTVVISFS